MSLSMLALAGIAYVVMTKESNQRPMRATEETFRPDEPSPANPPSEVGPARALANVQFPVSRINPPRYNERLEKGSL